MKSLLLFALVLIVSSCSNPNEEFINKLKQEKIDNALGIDLKYKVVKFEMLDTLFNQEVADSLKIFLTDNLKSIKQIDLNKNEFIKYRNQEQNLRDDENYYDDVVFNDNNDSKWLRELKAILIRTDKLLSDFENINILEKFELYSWYNRRYWQFNMNSQYEESFNVLYEKALNLKELEKEISELQKDPIKIVHYKTRVNYTQVNPLLGGAKQNLTEIKYFDGNKNLLDTTN